MKERYNSQGFDLSEVSQNEWIFNVRNGRVYVGTFKEVAIFAITTWGFKLEDIQFAVSQMIEKGHNSAHFGMYRTMIFTFNREDKKIA